MVKGSLIYLYIANQDGKILIGQTETIYSQRKDTPTIGFDLFSRNSYGKCYQSRMLLGISSLLQYFLNSSHHFRMNYNVLSFNLIRLIIPEELDYFLFKSFKNRMPLVKEVPLGDK